jgi:hypothetical protein
MLCEGGSQGISSLLSCAVTCILSLFHAELPPTGNHGQLWQHAMHTGCSRKLPMAARYDSWAVAFLPLGLVGMHDACISTSHRVCP